MKNYALLSSWDPSWINDHQKWLAEYGPHHDGWTNRISEENIELVKISEAANGYIWLYAYMPKSKGGNMKVCHRFKVQNIEYTKELLPFEHLDSCPGLAHSGQGDYRARLKFLITEIQEIQHIEPTEFVTSKGE